MSMSRPGPGPGPMSPMSVGSNDSFASRYGSLAGTPGDAPYSGGSYGVPRAPPTNSPPGSNHPSGSTDSSRPSASGSSMNRPPSSASSVGGRSDGRMGGFPAGPRDSGRKKFDEDRLQRHYHVLQGYLGASLRDEKGNIKPNKARDKLLRLSVTQFMELSTDVFDELIRREDQRLQRVANVPPALPPKRDFHPKRNQARQKLSTLPTERFRQLATDVFYELERRIPRFAGSEMDRPMSGQSTRSMRPPPGYRGPPGPGGRPPMGTPPNGMPPPNAPYQSFRPASPGPLPGTRPPTGGSDSSTFQKPLPKTFQSNTIVPNKSTMVEEDDSNDEDEEEVFGLDKMRSGVTSERFSKATDAIGGSSFEDQEQIRAQEAEIGELKAKMMSRDQELEALRTTMSEKEQELHRVKSSGQEREEGLSSERNEWFKLREELEQKHNDARTLNENLQRELDMLKQSQEEEQEEIRARHERELDMLKQSHDEEQEEAQTQHERALEDIRSQLGNSHRMTIGDLRGQLDNVHSQSGDLHKQLEMHEAENEQLRQQLQSAQQLQRTISHSSESQRRIEDLETQLALHQKSTDSVHNQAMTYLQEMRALAHANDAAIAQEETLAARITTLERDIAAWRTRYAKLKAQNKSLRASTLGLGPAQTFDSGSLVRQEALVSDSGLVRDTDVTHFQLSIDELLKTARGRDTDPMLESVKNVVVCVQSMTAAVGTDGYPTPVPSPTDRQSESVERLKARVMGTANSLITATKQHATAQGLSPVALLDAAASNLTGGVVELIKAVGIRSSGREELQYEEGLSFYHDGGEEEEEGEEGSVVEIEEPEKEQEKVAPAPLTLGRSNTGKSTKGWFGGWGKKTSVDEGSGGEEFR